MTQDEVNAIAEATEKEYMRERAREVADTILEQLGRNHFAAMTGAKNFTIIPFSANYPNGGLDFALPLGGFNKGVNKVTITLNGNDTYKMVFSKFRKAYVKGDKFVDAKVKIVKQHNEIYCDQLHELFEEATGLLTSIYPRR